MQVLCFHLEEKKHITNSIFEEISKENCMNYAEEKISLTLLNHEEEKKLFKFREKIT